MTDHANELRRYSRKIGHPAGDVPSVMLAAAEEIERLAARLEVTEEDRSNFLVEIGKLCAQCDALRAKIEEAESDALEQARLNGMGSEREAALMAKLEEAEKDIAIKEEVIDSLATVIKRLDAQCDAAEKERNTLRTTVRHESDCVEAAKAEIKALRAKVEAMEKQEPAARTMGDIGDWVSNGDGTYSLGGCLDALMPLPDETPLYALHGAQPAPSVPDVDALAQFIREVDGSHQLGAGVLAERIAEWLKAAPEANP